MKSVFTASPSASGGGTPSRFPRRWLHRLLRIIWNPRSAFLFACLATLIALFYAVENGRGRRAWEQCQRELTAKGEKLDYLAFLPPAVPDDQNVMKHPFIRDCFFKMKVVVMTGGKTNFVTSDPLPVGHKGNHSLFVTPVGLVSLKYLEDLPKVRDPHSGIAAFAGEGSSKRLPKVEFHKTPLEDVVTQLAKEVGVAVRLPSRKPPFWHYRPSSVSGKWGYFPKDIELALTNVTAVEALNCVLTNYALVARSDESLKVALIEPAQPSLADVQLAISDYDEVFRQLDEVFRRPYFQVLGNPSQPLEVPVPGFVAARTVAQVLACACKVNLLVGRHEEAMRDLRLMRGVMKMMAANRPPFLVGAMIEVAVAGLYVNAIEETLAAGLWRPQDLAEIQRQLSSTDLLSEFALSLRGERASVLQTYSPTTMRLFYVLFTFHEPLEQKFPWYGRALAFVPRPKGWLLQNFALIARSEQVVLDGLDPADQRVDARKLDAAAIDLRTLTGDTTTPYNILAKMVVPNASLAAQTVARNQTRVNEAIVACALERYRGENGRCPESLDALVPKFAEKLPHDLFDGQPLRYRPTGDGKFLLYSIGWNSKDDGGKALTTKQGLPDWSSTEGDWVWQGVPQK